LDATPPPLHQPVPDELPIDPVATFETVSLKPRIEATVPDSDSRSSSTISPRTAWHVVFEEPSTVQEPGRSAPTEFTLLREIGKGGMGEVWEARQESLQRVVAIKRIRANRGGDGSSSDPSVEREFRNEAIISARLEHPNIVPVHDLGVSEDGAQLLAMKRVQGRGWANIIAVDWPVLSPSDFLAKHLPILKDVAQAVAFAHAQGIIHRDLKPRQVMVGEFGEVVLMDWGLAIYTKNIASMAEADRTLHLPSVATASSPAGTPSLMAPEQTEATGIRLGPWTDIYLLGGTLYHLLCGVYPHSAANSRAAFLHACTGDIEPPSVRVTDRPIPGELEALCLACLEREPSNRLASVTEFLAAIDEFITGASKRRQADAMIAEARAMLEAPQIDYHRLSTCLTRINRATELWSEHPALPSLRNQVHGGIARNALSHGDLSFARAEADRVESLDDRERLVASIDLASAKRRRAEIQRRTTLVASMGFLITLVVGGAFFSWRMKQANDRTSRVLGQSDGLVSFMLDDVRERLALLDRLDLMESILDEAFAHLEERLDDVESDRELHRLTNRLIKITDNYSRMANTTKSLEAIARMEDVADRFWSSADPIIGDEVLVTADQYRYRVLEQTGRIAEAVKLARERLAVQERKAARERDDRLDYITSHRRWDLAAKLLLMRETVEAETEMIRALREFDQTSATMTRLAIMRPESAIHARSVRVNALASILLNNGKPFPALEFATDSLTSLLEYGDPATTTPPYDIWRNDVCVAHTHVGGIFNNLQRHADAKEHFLAALAIKQRMYDEDPTNATQMTELWSIHHNLVVALSGLRDYEEAMRYSLEGEMVLRRLLGLRPNLKTAERNLVTTLSTRGALLVDKGDYAKAEEALAIATQRTKELIEQEPGVVDFERLHFSLLVRTYDIVRAMGTVADGLRVSQEMVEAAEKYWAKRPGDLNDRRHLSIALVRQGAMLLRAGRAEEAAAVIERGSDIQHELFAERPDHPESRRNYVVSLQQRMDAYERAGRYDEALTYAEQAYTQLEEILTTNPTNPMMRGDVGTIALQYAGLLAQQGDNERASVLASRSIEIRKGLAEASTQDLRTSMSLLLARTEFAGMSYAAEPREEHLAKLQDVLTDSRILEDHADGNLEVHQGIAKNKLRIGQYLARAGEFEKAKAPLREGWDQLDSLFVKDSRSYAAIDTIFRGYSVGLEAVAIIPDWDEGDELIRRAMARLDDIDAMPLHAENDRANAYATCLLWAAVGKAKRDQADEATQLLERMTAHGLRNRKPLLDEPALEPLRANPSPALSELIARGK